MTKATKADEGNDYNGHDLDVEAFCSVSKWRGDSEFVDGGIGWCLDLIDLLLRTAPVDIVKAGESPLGPFCVRLRSTEPSTCRQLSTGIMIPCFGLFEYSMTLRRISVGSNASGPNG